MWGISLGLSSVIRVFLIARRHAAKRSNVRQIAEPSHTSAAPCYHAVFLRNWGGITDCGEDPFACWRGANASLQN
jgi:hypothetical protein